MDNSVDKFHLMSEHACDRGDGWIPMNNTLDALENAVLLYEQYAQLAALGELSMLGSSDSITNEIVASVSPVMRESYSNAIVG